MASNADEMVPPVQDDFPNLRADVPGADARGRTAYPVELTWFRRRLARGVARLRLFLVTRAAVRPAEPVTAPDGTRLTSHDQRPTTDDAVFGQGRFWRQACTALGPEGCSPLDAELSWPARGSSDLRREWAVDGTPDESSRESQTGRARILGRSLSVHALESGVAAAGGAVPPVDDQPPAAGPPAARGTIRVVPAEGPGVPLVQPPPQTSPVRLGKGQPHGTKQEAVVTGLSTMAPYPRTPPEVGAALGQEASRPEPAARPRSEGQELRATWAGKAVAMRRLGERVAQRHGPHLQPRVALTEGAEVWPPHGVTPVPEDPVIWDLSHATASLGETAKALRGATHPQRLAWVRASLEPRLAG